MVTVLVWTGETPLESGDLVRLLPHQPRIVPVEVADLLCQRAAAEGVSHLLYRQPETPTPLTIKR